MALDDFDRWAGNELERFAYDDSRYKIVKVKGYDNGKSSKEDCYACATQRHACEHDEIDYVKYQEGKSWEDDYEEDIY